MKDDIMSISEQEKAQLFQCERRMAIMIAAKQLQAPKVPIMVYSSGDCIVPGSCGSLSQRPYRDITSKDSFSGSRICVDGWDRP